MRKMKMLKTALGSPNGAHVFEYEKDSVHALPADLAETFERDGVAEDAPADEPVSASAPTAAHRPAIAGDADAAPDFRAMKKDELAAFVSATYGHTFPRSTTKAEMVSAAQKLAAAKAAAPAA